MLDAVRMAADDDAVIEGWLVPFDGSFNSGKDSYGTAFSARTDYRLDWFPSRPLLYNHGLLPDTGLDPVGTIRSLEIRENGGAGDKGGVWMEAELSRQSQYFDAIRQMVKDGKLFLSSASVEHLVKINQRSGDVEIWPIFEGSLTPVPSNLYATVAARSVQEHYDAAGIDIPDEAATAMRTASDESTDVPATKSADTALIVNGLRYVRADTMDDDGPGDGDGSDVGSDERSFEDICADLDALLNPMYASAYTRRLNTFPTHVLVKRCEPGSYDDDDDGTTYWDIPYTLGADQEPVLGTPVQVQRNETYTPVARSFDAPLSFETQQLLNHLAAFTASTEDYGERRYREGREISGMNLQTMGDAIDGMQGHLDKMRELHGRASARKEEAARAALAADPEYRRALMEMLAF